MQIDLDKIKKLPPDVKRDFMKMYLKLDEKKKILKVKDDFLSFAKHMWPEFIEGRHHKIIGDKFNQIAKGKIKPSPNAPKIWFDSLESMAQVLSSQNRALLRLIREHNPQSLTELARVSGRKKKA